MNITAMARQECANHIDHECAGVDIKTDGSQVRFKPEGEPCTVHKERCRYFEEAVLPLADMATDPRTAKAFQDARFKYKMKYPEYHGSTRICEECNRNPVIGRSKYCSECKVKRRRKQTRESVARHRAQNEGPM